MSTPPPPALPAPSSDTLTPAEIALVSEVAKTLTEMIPTKWDLWLARAVAIAVPALLAYLAMRGGG